MSGANIIADQILEGRRREHEHKRVGTLCANCTVPPIAEDGPFTEPETVEFRGVQVEVVDPATDETDHPYTFEDTFVGIFSETFDLLVERQKKYGPKNIAQQGLFGILTRIKDDKISRIMRALNGRVENGQIILDAIDLSGEEGDTLEDALKDVANYALIALALLRGAWGRPLAEEVVGNDASASSNSLSSGEGWGDNEVRWS